MPEAEENCLRAVNQQGEEDEESSGQGRRNDMGGGRGPKGERAVDTPVRSEEDKKGFG